MSGGKTYSAVRDMLERIRTGHIVVTNVELNLSACSDFLGVSVADLSNFYWRIRDDEDDLGPNEVHVSDYDSWPCGSPRGSATYDSDLVYIYLDEASSIFDAMTSGASESIKKVAAWARHTEKRGQMLYLIMQFENELHKRLRVHITEFIYCKNMSKVVVPILRCHLPKFASNFVSQIHLLPDGETSLGSPDFVPLDSRIFACYRTAQIVVGGHAFSRAAIPDFSADSDVSRSCVRLMAFCCFLSICLLLGVIWQSRHLDKLKSLDSASSLVSACSSPASSLNSSRSSVFKETLGKSMFGFRKRKQ